jgi:hypothetical protein
MSSASFSPTWLSWLDDPDESVSAHQIASLFNKLRLTKTSHFDSNVHSVWNRSDNDDAGSELEMNAKNGDSNTSASGIEVKYHVDILDRLRNRLREGVDKPSHIAFSGENDSFLSIPAMSMSCPKEYTFASWICIDEQSPSKGFLLFRCRSTLGGIDAIMSDKQEDDKWMLTLRSYVGGAGLQKAQIKGEIRGLKIQLVPNKWHLICVRHRNCHAYLSADRVTVSVDGVPVLPESMGGGVHTATDPAIIDEEASLDLEYPFRDQVRQLCKGYICIYI